MYLEKMFVRTEAMPGKVWGAIYKYDTVTVRVTTATITATATATAICSTTIEVTGIFSFENCILREESLLVYSFHGNHLQYCTFCHLVIPFL